MEFSNDFSPDPYKMISRRSSQPCYTKEFMNKFTCCLELGLEYLHTHELPERITSLSYLFTNWRVCCLGKIDTIPWRKECISFPSILYPSQNRSFPMDVCKLELGDWIKICWPLEFILDKLSIWSQKVMNFLISS